VSSNPRFLGDAVQMLAPLEGTTSQSMSGGYGIFSEGNMFALISGSELFLKVDDYSLQEEPRPL
jgi:TfoX/Sxy family transcriptional regulator of competence genes